MLNYLTRRDTIDEFDLSGRIAIAIKRICLLRRLKEGRFALKNAPSIRGVPTYTLILKQRSDLNDKSGGANTLRIKPRDGASLSDAEPDTGERPQFLSCKAIVELHQGSIRAESAGAGEGSTFIVELPGEAAFAAQDAP